MNSWRLLGRTNIPSGRSGVMGGRKEINIKKITKMLSLRRRTLSCAKSFAITRGPVGSD